MEKGNTISNTEPLNFGDFPAATHAEWRDAAVAALKGADFDRSLYTKLVEGITLQPIYEKTDVKSPEETPGEFPYRRGTSTLGYTETPWEVAQSIVADSPEEYNKALLHDLQRGLDSVNIVLNCKNGLKFKKQSAWSAALKDVVLNAIPVYINPGSCGMAPFAMYINEYESRGYNTADMKGGILYDPIAKLVSKGSLCGGKGMCAYYDQMATITKWAIEKAPAIQTIGVSGLPYHDSGASAFEEIGSMLATAVAYLRAMEERGISVEDTAARMRFTVGVGSNLFLEIAKIRALRQLWASIVKSCGASDEAAKIKIHARTSSWTVSKVDPWVNMLRGTAQTFSAVIGGVDSLDVVPFDSAIRTPDEFARRIARNTQLILRGECCLDKVVDPAGGSWYIENLTEQVAMGSWDMFQYIEDVGGIIKALKSNVVQDRVNATVNKRYELADQRRQTLVGVNRYVNLDEKQLEGAKKASCGCGCKKHAHGQSDVQLPEVKLCMNSIYEVAKQDIASCLINKAVCALCDCECGEAIEIAPLPLRRASERFERLLDKASAWQVANGKRPAVFLANMGPLRQHKARADFSQDFLRSGGFDLVYPAGFQTPEEAAKAFAESGCKVCVICSTDDTYPELVPGFCSAVKSIIPDTTIALAGYPADHVESFKQAGVDIFIHVKANCYETLDSIQTKLGL